MTEAQIDGPSDLVLVLDEVTFLDSLGLGVLIGAHKRARVLQGSLTIVCTSSPVLNVFSATSLDRVFTIVSTLDEAPRLTVSPDPGGAAARGAPPQTGGIKPLRLNARSPCCSWSARRASCWARSRRTSTRSASTADGVTYFVGSVFFTSASFSQLVQAQTPAMTEVDDAAPAPPAPVRCWAWLPHDRAWLAAATQFPGTLFFNVSTVAALVHNATVQQEDRHVWRPDFFGSTLFLVASWFAMLALGRTSFWRPASRLAAWRIAWLNMLGSILFMVSALASYVLPEHRRRDRRAGSRSPAPCSAPCASSSAPP